MTILGGFRLFYEQLELQMKYNTLVKREDCGQQAILLEHSGHLIHHHWLLIRIMIEWYLAQTA